MRGILVGLGGRAKSWLDVCRRNAEVELVGFVEVSPARRERVTAEWNLPKEHVFESLETALKAVEADFICDVTPPAAHESVALQAFDAGLHVLGEKPLSDTFAAARRMVAAAEKTGRVHVITQNYRFGRTPRTAHRLLKEGFIGNPEQVVVGFYMPWAKAPGTHYVTMPYPLITDMGIHHFDMLRYVLDREPVNVLARTWNVSWGWHAGDAAHTALFEFEGSLMVTHHALGASVGKRSPWNGEWRIEGPLGSLTWEDDALYVTTNNAGPKGESRTQIPLDDLPIQGQDALLHEFLSAIRENREPECSSRDNIKSLAMVFAAIKSAQEKRPVDIAEMFA